MVVVPSRAACWQLNLLVGVLIWGSSAELGYGREFLRGSKPTNVDGRVRSRQLQSRAGRVEAQGRVMVVGTMPVFPEATASSSSAMSGSGSQGSSAQQPVPAGKHYWLMLEDSGEHVKLTFHANCSAAARKLRSGELVALAGAMPVLQRSPALSRRSLHSIVGRGAGSTGASSSTGDDGVGASQRATDVHTLLVRPTDPAAYAGLHLEVHSFKKLSSHSTAVEALQDSQQQASATGPRQLQEQTPKNYRGSNSSSPLLQPTLETGPDRAWGTPRVLVVPISWCGRPPYISADNITSGWFPKLAKWSSSCSFNKTVFLSANVKVQPLEMCFNLEGLCPYLTLSAQAEPLLAAMLGPRVLIRFDHVVYITPEEFECSESNLSGAGLMPGKVVWLDRLFWSDVPTLGHELGHNWGLEHGWQNGQEYLDWSDVMGNAHQYLCMNAPHAWQLQWANPLATISSFELKAGSPITYTLPSHMDNPLNSLRLMVHNAAGSADAPLVPGQSNNGISAPLVPNFGGIAVLPDSLTSSYMQLWVSYMLAKGGSRGMGPDYAGKVNVWRWDGQTHDSNIETYHLAALGQGQSWTDPLTNITITHVMPFGGSAEYSGPEGDADPSAPLTADVRISWARGTQVQDLVCGRLQDCDSCLDPYVNATCADRCAACSSCEDVDPGCASILESTPDVCTANTQYYNWMLGNCRNTCSLCMLMPPAAGGCVDGMEGCTYLVTNSPELCLPASPRYSFMTKYCNATCQMCTPGAGRRRSVQQQQQQQAVAGQGQWLRSTQGSVPRPVRLF